MFKPVKNVPLPKAARHAPPARRKYPFDEMDVGMMFFVPNKTKNTLSTHVSTTGKALRRKFETRLTHMRETEKGRGDWRLCKPGDKGATLGIGVWRTK